MFFVSVVAELIDQNPEDVLFPACRKHNVAVIARVPFDEGSLTGTLTPVQMLELRRFRWDR